MDTNYALNIIEVMAYHPGGGAPSDEECAAVKHIVSHVREAQRIQAAKDKVVEAARGESQAHNFYDEDADNGQGRWIMCSCALCKALAELDAAEAGE